MKILEKIVKIWPAYAASAFERSKRYSIENEILYTESQCMSCPWEHSCCNYLVGVTPFEVIPIIEHIKTLSNSKLIFDKIKARAKTFRKFMKKYSSMKEGEIPWKELGKKCVFYDKEKRQCSIYEIRPMNCRTYFSTKDCSKHQGQSLKEEEHVVKDRFHYVTSHTLDPSQPFELCTTITKMLKNPELKISEKFKNIAEKM